MNQLFNVLASESLKNCSTIYVAYSGGVDSHVLLHGLARAVEKIKSEKTFILKAIHVHHGLDPNADHWASHCEEVSKKLGAEFLLERVQIKIKPGESLEAIARTLRYSAMQKHIGKNACLMMGHHQEDQAETFFLQLMRGAGPKGLASMPVIKTFGEGILIRPFLKIEHQEILAYAKKNDLTWIEDPSNRSLKFDRNFIRHDIFPLLKQRWPSMAKTVSRSAELCSSLQVLHEDNIQVLLETILDGDKVKISALTSHSKEIQVLLIRAWLQKLDLPSPQAIHLDEISRQLLNVSYSGLAKVKFDKLAIQRRGDSLYAVWDNVIPAMNETVLPWDLKSPLFLPHKLGTLYCEQAEIGLAKSKLNNLHVTFRKGGETFHPQEKEHNVRLKKYFQEKDIPTWERSKIPLLFSGSSLVAVIGYSISADFLASSCEDACTIRLEK